MTPLTRRKLLYGLSLSAGVGGLAAAARERSTGADSAADRVSFDPTVDAFGFDNYSTPPVAPKPSEVVSGGELREYLLSYGSAVLQHPLTYAPGGSEPRIGAVVEHLYANANRLFGTKGYCYGMASAVQWYREEPDAVPVDRDSTSEITHLDAPLENPSSTPVRDDIEQFQQSQFTDLESWLQRLPLLRPERIDYRSQARDLRREIDEYGTAGVTISGENVLDGHYVLLYDYDVRDTDVLFAAYDPNDDAADYAAGESRTIGIDTTADGPLLGSYGDEYDRFLFTRADRALRERIRSKRRR